MIVKMKPGCMVFLAIALGMGPGLFSQPVQQFPDNKKDIQVAVYYFPNWGPVATSEWKTIQSAKPMFAGHQQPKIPLWGYQNENLPEVMEQKIATAAGNGIDAFIFDWYYFDSEYGGKYLYKALEDGFLKASNNDRLKFSLMWCNHDVGPDKKGAIRQETFEKMTDYIVDTYFKYPSYWKINGCPYFSIYLPNKLLETFSGDLKALSNALERFRSKVKKAGFPDLHLNAVLFGVSGELLDYCKKHKLFNSLTFYTWLHHEPLPTSPESDYVSWGNKYMKSLSHGGGYNGLEKPVDSLPLPYYVNVTMGWDSSPRCKNDPEWSKKKGYPYGPVIKNNTPENFEKFLKQAKEYTENNSGSDQIITVNSWNEWGEGSYLEPDNMNGMGYLEAIKRVFN